MQKNGDDTKIQLAAQIRHRAVEEEGVLIHLDNGRVIVVNEVGLFIVQKLDTPVTQEELTAAIAGEFDISTDQAAKDLKKFLAELDAEQAIERSR